MIGIVRDIVRAGLVLVVLAVGLELLQTHREAARPPDPPPWQPAVIPQAAPPAWQPAAAVYAQPPQAERPLRRVAGSVVDLADSILGVIR